MIVRRHPNANDYLSLIPMTMSNDMIGRKRKKAKVKRTSGKSTVCAFYGNTWIRLRWVNIKSKKISSSFAFSVTQRQQQHKCFCIAHLRLDHHSLLAPRLPLQT